MCLSPINLKKKEWTGVGYRTNRVPCGRCVECLRIKASAWTFRLVQEAKRCTSCAFLTLTYNEQFIPLAHWDKSHKIPAHELYNKDPYDYQSPSLNKPELQKFFKRLRKRTHNKIKYYACGEYGTKTERPHYHAIIFNMPLKWINDPETIEQCWSLYDSKEQVYYPKGNIDIGKAHEGGFKYVAKYIMKSNLNKFDSRDPREPEFSVMSKNLGDNFLTPSMVKHLKDNMTTVIEQHGIKTSMSRYYRKKFMEHLTMEEAKIIHEKMAKYQEEQFEKVTEDFRMDVEIRKSKIEHGKRKIREERQSL